MKVILVNGSPHEHGCTDVALREVEKTIKAAGIETEIYWIGKQAIVGCQDCRACAKDGRCVFNDKVNEFADLAEKADGFVFGAPVHYASINGTMRCFLDRLFYSAGRIFYLKPGAVVTVARRAGTTATIDQLNKYITISQMPLISSCYWTMVHGAVPEEVAEDKEGLQVMRTLGRNMAWFLQCKEAGAKAGVPLPEQETRVWTNFTR
ncbi:MAG: flavodoxin family protein [Spirochaetaceae bacterium]|jgi:multimeric flavodoxin WrbA|nr:flavodoxin family protein [Spirochaetaceae bacterium]